MRRWLIALLAGLGWLVGVAAPGAAAATPPRAELRGFACHLALDPPDRSIAIRAIMRPLPGTEAMQLRFVLLAKRRGSAAATAVHAGDLGRWLSPRDPTLGQNPADVWIFRKPVLALSAPAAYRFQVWFRWLGAGGQVLETVVHYTQRCRQRELRPDLSVVAPIAIAPVAGQPSLDAYTATIRNGGETGAGPFLVEFVPGDGSPASTQTVPWLAAHQQVALTFVGPACAAAGAPTIIADSTLEIDDSSRANNTLTATCPVPGPPANGNPPPGSGSPLAH